MIGFYPAVAAGGALGALLRYGVEEAIRWGGPPAVPVATLAVNLAGCLAIGFFLAAAADSARVAAWRPFLAVGLLGGFTTYSALAVEAVALARGDAAVVAIGYLAVSLAGGLLAVSLGERLLRRTRGAAR